MATSADLAIKDLGPCRYPSPVAEKLGEKATVYVAEADKVLFDDRLSAVLAGASGPRPPAFELAGPRNRVFWEPREMRAGIVTCGGLCPGVNNVIRGLVLTMAHSYGVQEIFGFRYGYEGLAARFGHAPMRLEPRNVEEIHRMGGTVRGTSRGNQDPHQMVDTLAPLGINVLFVVGGDGTLRGAISRGSRRPRRWEQRRRGTPVREPCPTARQWSPAPRTPGRPPPVPSWPA
ncbi:6-phosphofructokinase [Sorangium sp. So ce362]|uniref:6-phosphofructokinase n=1 Tax=Sorangium sp. So ce362 TaxID=3133303 RepID=UPI003F5F7307